MTVVVTLHDIHYLTAFIGRIAATIPEVAEQNKELQMEIDKLKNGKDKDLQSLK